MAARIQIAKADIFRLLDERPQKVYRRADLAAILHRERHFWRLTQSTTITKFIAFLMKSGRLREIVFPFQKPYHRETRYAWGDASFSEIVLTLKPNCHFSHYSAVKFHGLTEQIPKTTYINFEQPLASNATGELSQGSIDRAFKNKVRTTNYVAETDEFRVCILNGKNTGYLGVVEQHGTNEFEKIRVTDLERTMIDIVVRPIYSGGVHEVLKAYRLAQPAVSINRLAAMLQKLEYIYPYHQAIGFYLERSGYKPSQLDLLRRFNMTFDFYLVHQMKNTEYIKDWKIYIPKGL